MALLAPSIVKGLYLVSTPIGTLTDISLRALDLLERADILLAEDTRRTRHLLELYEIKLGTRKLWKYNDYSDALQRSKIVTAIDEGNSVALLSDAGTPLIADPGYRLVHEVISHGQEVTSVPGASALLSAISISGLPTDKFLFAGFVPVKQMLKTSCFHEYSDINATVIFYESPKRLCKTLVQMANIFGDDRDAVVCRELTKVYEEVLRGTLREIIDCLEKRKQIKGECVILLGKKKKPVIELKDLMQELKSATETMSRKDSVSFIAEKFGLSKREVYTRALELRNDKD